MSGRDIVLRYSEALARSSATNANASGLGFIVMVEAGGTDVVREISHAAVSGSTVVLNLMGRAVAAGEEVKITYGLPENADFRIQDSDGNSAGALSERILENNTASPTLVTATVNDKALVLTFSAALDKGSAPIMNTAPGIDGIAEGVGFWVSVAGNNNVVAGVAVKGSAVTLTLMDVVRATDGQVQVSYSVACQPDGNGTAGCGGTEFSRCIPKYGGDEHR